jgi:hypothetical protein
LETIERDYAPQGVKFFYIYKALAHPETNGYITPFTLEERLMHVAEAKRTLGTKFDWICDSMDNDLKHALGDRPNSEFIIDPKGEIVVARQWSKPADLRQDLERLIGKVDRPTTAAELKMPKTPPPSKAATGIVKRVELPGGLSPLKIAPVVNHAEKEPTPHYAKLRAELSGDQLYLGFFLDPLYRVHWNNKAPAIKFSIEPPAGVSVTPGSGSGPKVEVDADADPREFLVTVSGRSDDPMKVTVNYFACDDAETFCLPVTQVYEVSFERDRDGGNRRTGGGVRGASRGPGGSMADAAARENRMTEMMRRVPVLVALDRDRDGILSARELENAPRSLLRADRNRDGEISGEELRPRPAGPGRR